MVRFRSLLFLFLLPLGLGAQFLTVGTRIDAGGQSDSSAAPGTIDGRVTNAQTGDGVSGASVRLAPMRMPRSGTAAPDAKATTAADGSFHFDSVSPGSYFAIVEGKGFVASGSRAALRPVSVSAGQQVSDVNISLVPQAIVSGKVVDEDGNAQNKARIEALVERPVRGKLQLYRVSQTMTNESGHYSLGNLSPGRYYLLAEPEQAASTTQQKDKSGAPPMDLVRTYYPKSLDIGSADTVDVQSGQDLSGTNIQLRRVATHHLRGKVAGLSGAATQRDTLLLAPKADIEAVSFGRRAKLAADGTFDFDKLVPGQYTLRLVGNESGQGIPSRYMSRHLLARQDVEIGASDVNGVDLAILSPVVVAGRVTMDGIQNPNFSQVRITLAPAADDMAYGSYQNAQVGADGSFSFPNLSPAKYVVHAVGTPPGTYLKSLSFNGQEVLTQDMDLSQGGGGELSVVFHSGAAEIDGTVQVPSQSSQIPLASASGGQAASPFPMVILLPDKLSADGTGWLVAPVQPSGSFAVANLRPGHYTAFAVEHFDGNIWQNPSFLQQIQSEGIGVDLDEGEHKQVQLATIGNDRIQQAAASAGIDQ